MRRYAVAATMVLAGIAGANDARASETLPVVVELFTSQGCSSCPPADAFLAKLAQRSDVIALSLHVDYWDYLGWRDEFGSPAHTARQRAYAAAMGERMIYTPQAVVQGVEHAVGSQVAELSAVIERHGETPKAARVALARDGDRVLVRIEPTGAAARPRGRVMAAWFSDVRTVAIGSGENKGLTVDYANVVMRWTDLGLWSGDAAELTTLTDSDADGVAVLIQGGEGGPIVGAASLALR